MRWRTNQEKRSATTVPSLILLLLSVTCIYLSTVITNVPKHCYMLLVSAAAAAAHRSEKQLQRVITMTVEFIIMIMTVIAGTIIMLDVTNGSKQYWQFKQKYNKFNLFELIDLRNFSEFAVVLVRHPYPDRAFRKGRPVIGKRFNVHGSRQSSTTPRKALTEAFLFIRLWHSDFWKKWFCLVVRQGYHPLRCIQLVSSYCRRENERGSPRTTKWLAESLDEKHYSRALQPSDRRTEIRTAFLLQSYH